MIFKSFFKILPFLLLTPLFGGCYNYYSATSETTYRKTLDEVEKELNKLGYFKTGVENRVENKINVKGTSYTSNAGYGTLFGNNYVYYDSYTFSNENSETLTYSVSYNYFYCELDSVVESYVYDTTHFYKFSGDTAYSINKRIKKEKVFDYVVINVSVPQCKTSSHKDFEQVCGNGAVLNSIKTMPRDRKVKESEPLKTFFATMGVLGGMALLAFLALIST